MSKRFVTSQEKRDREALEERASYAESRRKEDERKEMMTPQLDALEPIVRAVWQDFANAREMKGGVVTRLSGYGRYYGFSLEETREGAAAMQILAVTPAAQRSFQLRLTESGELHLVQPDGWQRLYHEDAEDLAQVLADETGRDVYLLVHVPYSPAVGSDGYAEEAHDRVIYQSQRREKEE